MTIPIALEAATFLALAATLYFIVTYAFVPYWWKSSLGRALMSGGVAVALVAGIGTIRRIDDRVDEIDFTTQLSLLTIFAYLLIAVVWFRKARVIHEEHRSHDAAQEQSQYRQATQENLEWDNTHDDEP